MDSPSNPFWVRIETSLSPPWMTAPTLVGTGRELIFLGGCLPQNVGDGGIRWSAVSSDDPETGWKCWYGNLAGRTTSNLGTAWIFDAKSQEWSETSHVEVACGSDLWRSHSSAAFVPTVGKIFIYGGSRYFRGEYFHDLLTIDLPSDKENLKPDLNMNSNVWPGTRLYSLRGQIGRVKGGVGAGELSEEQYMHVLRQVEGEEEARDDTPTADDTTP